MSLASRLLRGATAALMALPLIASAQGRIIARPEVRVLAKVNPAIKKTLNGQVPLALGKATIGGRLAASTRMDRMLLVLQPSGEQEAALHTLLDAQQDKNSPSFHKWLTPEVYGQTFGVAQTDIDKVTAWLQDSGFNINQISPSRRVIEFSGTVGTVESAFQTEMRSVTLDGEEHVSNTTEISVPEALAPVIHGIARLNNFAPRSNARVAGTATLRKPTSVSTLSDGATPDYGSSATGTHYVGPSDVATIFNATPLTTAPTPIKGTGTTIAVLGRTAINLGDIAAFRSLFGLPAKTPKVTLVGGDPGLNADDTEAYLDVEWAGAVAPDADINYIYSSPSLSGGDIDAAALYAVDNNIGDIISLSYGGCESNNGASGTNFWNILWEQAAAQGQTAFISSGDSGAAGCDSSSATYATGGYGVNALGSSAYNVAVGGSMFVDYGPAQYWGTASAPPYSTALSYIPEAALNQGRLTTTLLNSASTGTSSGSGIFAGGGGISIYTGRPSWQTGSGISSTADPTDYNGNAVPLTGSTVTGLHRLVPDISLISANGHDGTLFCAGGICSISSTGTLLNAGIVGGTSVATPVMASAQALINQVNGGRQGNANIYYYQLASNQYNASTTACQAQVGTASSPTVTLPASTCNFHDIIAGSIVVPTSSSGSAGIGYKSGTGFDEATGLGSVNIANVANNWSSVVFNATGTTLSLTPTTGLTHGATQTVSIQVTPASGSGTPTGDVSLIASSYTAYGDPQVFRLSGGAVNGTVNSLPAGTYTVYAHYAGDGTYASSNSAPVVVSIGTESSTTSQDVYQVTAAGAVNSISSFTYGSGQLTVDSNIAGASGNGTPSGTVTYAVTRNGSPLAPLTVNVDTKANAYFTSGPTFANFYLKANYPTLTPGSYSVTGTYSGDTSFTSSSATSAFTVTQATPTVSFAAASAQIVTGGSTATFNYSIATPSAAAAATGTVTFTDTTTSSTLGTVNLSNGAVVFNTTAITSPLGAHTITATYSGDTNYAPATSTTTVTLSTASAPTIAVSTSGTLKSGSLIGLTATLSSTAAVTTTVSFYDGGVLLGTSSFSSGGTTATLSTRYYTAGSHTFSATFAGNTSQTTATGSTTVTVAQNTPSLTLAVPTTGNYGSVPVSATIVRSPAPSSALATSIPVTGTVTFYDGSTTPAVAIATATPVFDPAYSVYYVANATFNNLSVGSHSIYAVYSGDTNYATATSSTNTIVIGKGNPGITVSPASLTQGATTTNVTVRVAFGGTAPTGTVTVSIDGGSAVAASCTGTTSPLICTASVPTASLSGGAHTATATIVSDANYNSASGTGAVTVTSDPKAVMVSPVPGSTLTGTTTTFTWTTGTGVANYVVYVGRQPGGSDIFSGNPVYSTSQTISGLPNDGSTIYVRLFSSINGSYQYNDYVYTAYSATPLKSAITSPTPGSTLTSSTVTFTWTNGTRVANNVLYVGRQPGGSDIFSGTPVYNTTSQTVSGVPTDGSTIYVRLFSSINGSYQYNDYTYTGSSPKAVMTSPIPGSTLAGTTVTFNWTAGIGVANYVVYVGSQPGGSDIFSGNPVYTTSQTISGLPNNGSTVYVRLFSSINGSYQYNDYVYTAYSATPVKAAITSPTPGSVLAGSTVTFTWTPGTRVDNYVLYIGTQPGVSDIYSGTPLYNTTSQTVSGIPTNGSTIYVRLFSSINGSYQYNDYSYTAASAQQ